MSLAFLGLLQSAPATARPIELTGPWRMRTGDDTTWAQRAIDETGWATVNVPNVASVPRSAAGFRWYRLAFTLPSDPAEPLAIQFRSVATVYEVYVDGHRLGGVGAFPPRYRARSGVPLTLALPPSLSVAGTHVVAVRVYSGENVAGIAGRVWLGAQRELVRGDRRFDYNLLAAALLLVGLGLAQIPFWVRRHASVEHLLILGYCVGLALANLSWMPSMRLALAPTIYWYRPFLGFACLATATFCWAFRRIFVVDGDRLVRFFGVLFAVIGVLAFVVPRWDWLRLLSDWLFDPAMLLCSATVLVIVVRMRRHTPHVKPLIWGAALLTAALFHDVAVSRGWLPYAGPFPWWLPFGAVIFCFSLTMPLARRFVETESLALYDQLTGLHRREVVLDALAREIGRAARDSTPLAVIMLDVDKFKEINDTLGHVAGDRVLAEVGRRMGDVGRAVDWLGRYGGEEFIALLTVAGTEGAVLAAERLRAAVSARPIVVGKVERQVTLSAGVEVWEGGPAPPTGEQLVAAADAALFRAKHAGRNRVERNSMITRPA